MQSEEEIKEAIEHRDVLLDVRAVLATNSGKKFFKYLFKHLEVTELPQFGLEGTMLSEKLGFLRAGNSIFKLIAEADANFAGAVLAEIEKERYAQMYANAQIGS